MDPLILSQKAQKWVEAVRYLNERKCDMSTDEETAFGFLAEAWRTRTFDAELSAEAREMIGIMTRCDQMHSSNRQIITHSKEMRGTAKLMYTQNASIYEEYRSALRKVYGSREPNPKPRPQPDSNPNPNATPNPTPDRFTVSSFSAYINDKGASNDPIHTVTTDVGYIGFRFEYRNPHPGRELEIAVLLYAPGNKPQKPSGQPYTFSGTDTLGASGRYFTCGWGSENGGSYEPGAWRAELYINGRPSAETSFLVKPCAINGPTIAVDNVRFVNADSNGNVLFDKFLAKNTKYLLPVITYRRLKRAGRIELTYKYFDPSGKLIHAENETAFTACSYLAPDDKGECHLCGFGNSEGTCYGYGRHRFELYQNGTLLYRTYVEIGAAAKPVNPNEAATPNPTPKPKPNPTPTPRHTPTPSPRKSGSSATKWIIGIVAAIFIAVGIAGYIFSQNYREEKAETRYASATMFLYEKPFDNNNLEEIYSVKSVGKVEAGSPVKMFKVRSDGWAEVKTDDDRKGYVGVRHLISQADKEAIDRVANGSREFSSGLGFSLLYDLIGRTPDLNTYTYKITDLQYDAPGAYKVDENNNVMSFVVSSADRSYIGVYRLDDSGDYTWVQTERRDSPLFISSMNFSKNRERASFRFNSAAKAVAPASAAANSDYPIVITDIRLLDTDTDGNIVRSYVTSSTKIASPKISYKVNNPHQTYDLRVSIYDPKGHLMTSGGADASESYIHSFQPSGASGSEIITGWGSTEASMFAEKGWRIEIRNGNTLIASIYY